MLKNLQISNALPLFVLTSGFVAIFAFFLLGEALKTTEILGLISLIAGTYILESKNLNEILFPFNIFIKSKYHQYILLALLLFAASSILDKLLLVKMNLSPISLTAFQHLFSQFVLRQFFIHLRKTAKKYSANFERKISAGNNPLTVTLKAGAIATFVW